MLRLYATVNVRRLGSGVVTSIDYNCKRQKEGKKDRKKEEREERKWNASFKVVMVRKDKFEACLLEHVTVTRSLVADSY